MYSKTVVSRQRRPRRRDALHPLRCPRYRLLARHQSPLDRRRRRTPRRKTTWYKVICWRKLAEIAAQYIRKGKLILVEGEVEASAFTGRDGEARAVLELTAFNIKFLGGRRDSDAGESEDESNVPEIGGDDPIPF